jgi:leucine dehydrogenase
MNVIEPIPVEGYEKVLAFQNPAVGLRGFLAIHDTTLGPALGGTRLRPYSSDDEALADALRLSRAMTYKAALAELPCGGGKAVIIHHQGLSRTRAFEAYGDLVESLRGQFFTGPDMGVTDDDLAAMARTTRYSASPPGLHHDDISEHTAIGVWHGLRACLDFAGLGRGARVALQGAGSVGLALGRILKQEGLELVVADTDSERARQAAHELGAEIARPEDILTLTSDVFSPCAVGGVVSVETAGRIRARIVCGCANNVLTAPEAGDELTRRGVLYAPDYLVNAGGLIRGAEFDLLKRSDSGPSLARIYHRMRRVLELAQQRRVSTARIADALAEERLQKPKSERAQGKTQPEA